LSFRAKREIFVVQHAKNTRFLPAAFRAKREIFVVQHAKNTRFLPAVEMTHSPNPTFYEAVNISGTDLFFPDGGSCLGQNKSKI
jgi:hypothetical protein